MKEIFNEISKPIAGLFGSVGTLTISLQEITLFAQCATAIVSLVIALLTIRLTILKCENETEKQFLNEAPTTNETKTTKIQSNETSTKPSRNCQRNGTKTRKTNTKTNTTNRKKDKGEKI